MKLVIQMINIDMKKDRQRYKTEKKHSLVQMTLGKEMIEMQLEL